MQWWRNCWRWARTPRQSDDAGSEMKKPVATPMRLTRVRQVAMKTTAFDIALKLGVIGMDADPRRDIAMHHSKYVKDALRRKHGSSM